MPDIDPNEFTQRENFILSYYRDRQLFSPSRYRRYDVAIALVSIGCMVLAAVREELFLGIVGYVLLLGRLYYLVTEGERWTKDFQNIFAKYEARLKALAEARNSRVD